jgi:hypothetical protein
MKFDYKPKCGECKQKQAEVYFEVITNFAWCSDCFDKWMVQRALDKEPINTFTFEEYLVRQVMGS